MYSNQICQLGKEIHYQRSDKGYQIAMSTGLSLDPIEDFFFPLDSLLLSNCYHFLQKNMFNYRVPDKKNIVVNNNQIGKCHHGIFICYFLEDELIMRT